jgi:hypothetical protein
MSISKCVKLESMTVGATHSNDFSIEKEQFGATSKGHVEKYVLTNGSARAEILTCGVTIQRLCSGLMY